MDAIFEWSFSFWLRWCVIWYGRIVDLVPNRLLPPQSLSFEFISRFEQKLDEMEIVVCPNFTIKLRSHDFFVTFQELFQFRCRAATIVLRENNCHFLRVDKENFNRILRDVEANTVRLKEHGKDVLVLEKISTQHKTVFSHFK